MGIIVQVLHCSLDSKVVPLNSKGVAQFLSFGSAPNDLHVGKQTSLDLKQNEIELLLLFLKTFPFSSKRVHQSGHHLRQVTKAAQMLPDSGDMFE